MTPASIVGFIGAVLIIHGLFLVCIGKVVALFNIRQLPFRKYQLHSIVIPKLKLGDVQRQIFLDDIWNVPIMPRLKMLQKPSIVFAWIAPTT